MCQGALRLAGEEEALGWAGDEEGLGLVNLAVD